ncbi:MAG: hypothetical protein AB7V50_04900 [Vampirovibrionia bacterium]
MFNKKYFASNYKQLYKLYKKAAEYTNVPPHFLAALHYREHAFKCSTPGPGGPMQFDPPLSVKRITQLLADYTQIPVSLQRQLASKGQDNFFVALLLAGCFVQAKLKYDHKSFLKKEMSSKAHQDLLMRAFELYNGTAYGSPWKSPYVSNMLDDNHQNMRIRGTYIDRRGIRRKVDIIDSRPGAYTVFKYLDESFTHNW